MKLKHNPLVRKALAQVGLLKRFAHRLGSTKADYQNNPPVFCNSFPKSGTHLLLQVLQAFPGKVHYGSFIATTPPIRFRRRSDRDILRRINAVAPGEIVPAHLYFSECAASALSNLGCVHFYIYRDLRDVMLSEANYFVNMAWWHALHRPFRKAKSDIERIRLSLHGIPESFAEYPDISKRFGFYEGWLDRDDTFSIRFEDFIGANREFTIRKMADFYASRTGIQLDTDSLIKEALHLLRPEASHTFHRGEAGRGAKVMPEDVRLEFIETAGELMKRLGYM